MGITRDEIKEIIRKNGGTVTSSVSRRTNYLILGTQVAQNLSDGVHSSKELKAKELISAGSALKIINFEELNLML